VSFLPVVVAAAVIAAAGRPPRNGREAAESRIFPPLLRLSRFMRDDRGHKQPL
jgi:hypothetical protein